MIECTTGFQNTLDLGRIVISVAIDHKIKAVSRKEQNSISGCLAKINTQRDECIPAMLHVGGIVLRCGYFIVGMVQGQKKFTAAGIDIQNVGIRFQIG